MENNIQGDQPSTPPQPSHAPTKSSPPKGAQPMVNPTSRSEWSDFVYTFEGNTVKTTEDEMIRRLCPNAYLSTGWNEQASSQPSSDYNSQTDILPYLTEVSKKIASVKSTKYTITFLPKESVAPGDHPTGTMCRPDFVGYRTGEGHSLTAKDIKWSHIQVTGEIWSKGKAVSDSQAQAAAYSAFNLQARPDLVSTPGFWVKDNHVVVFFTNASGIHYSSTYIPSSRGAKLPQLIYAFVWNLYHPIVDPSIEIDFSSSTPTFTVTVSPDRAYRNLSILRVGDTLGRRTMILTNSRKKSVDTDPSVVNTDPSVVNTDPNVVNADPSVVNADPSVVNTDPNVVNTDPNVVNTDPDVVIKEQYIQPGRGFREGDILDKVHQKVLDGCHFPGIVRHGDFREVLDGDKVISTGEGQYRRIKTRLVLLDTGARFSEIKSPREMLMISYDLLEVIRVLHRTRKISHRDISPNNILFRPMTDMDPQLVPKDIGDMCFSHCLLRPLEAPNNTEPSRLATQLLLVDFDSAQDKTVENSDGCIARTGTSAFMAIALRAGGTEETRSDIPPIPAIGNRILSRYKELLPKRLKRFPQNQLEEVKAPAEEFEAGFEHLLRYDAESVFWCMVWWLIQAQPKGSTESKLDAKAWQDLIGVRDTRYENFIFRHKGFLLHPTYAPIIRLLKEMAEHLRVDLKFSKDEIKKNEPEYLCEVFQRLILNFLVEHGQDDFLKGEKSPKWRNIPTSSLGRSPTNQSTTPRTTMAGTKRSHEQTETVDEKGSSSKKTKTTHAN